MLFFFSLFVWSIEEEEGAPWPWSKVTHRRRQKKRLSFSICLFNLSTQIFIFSPFNIICLAIFSLSYYSFFFFFILLFVIFFLGSPYPFRLFSIAGLLYFLGYLIVVVVVVVETAALFIYPVGLWIKRCLTLSAKRDD